VKIDTTSLVGKLGITFHGQKLLGDIQALNLPSIGDSFENNQ